MPRVLVVGETWMIHETHIKGWDEFTASRYESGLGPLQAALADSDVEIEHLPAHLAGAEFPSSSAELDAFDVVLLSDIGANTLLLHPDTWAGTPTVDRLAVLAEWVEGGGGLAMAGGYLSFQGIQARAAYAGTAVERVLPVELLPHDDRVEAPGGCQPDVVDAAHPVVDGITGAWPVLLGYNRLVARSDANILVRSGDDPLLAVGEVGSGRSLAWASDVGPHWCPTRFTEWDGYARLWQQAFTWLAGVGPSRR